MRFFACILLIVFCGFGLSGCIPETWRWHQKLVVAINTPSGPVLGASVVEAGWRDVDLFHNYSSHHKGEATVVKLGKGRYLFALLSDDTNYIGLRTFEAGFGPEAFQAMTQMKGVKTVSRKNYPLLVTFDDIHDPKTVRKVDPDDLDGTLGLCPDGSGLRDEDAPWRGQGLTFFEWWQQNEVLQRQFEERKKDKLFAAKEQAILETVEALKLPRRIDPLILKLKIRENDRPNWVSDSDIYDVYGFYDNQFDVKQRRKLRGGIKARFSRSRKQVLQEMENEQSRDTSKDCHAIHSMTLEITNEPVTKGKVEKVLRWLGDGITLNRIWKSLPSWKIDILVSSNWRKGI